MVYRPFFISTSKHAFNLLLHHPSIERFRRLGGMPHLIRIGKKIEDAKPSLWLKGNISDAVLNALTEDEKVVFKSIWKSFLD